MNNRAQLYQINDFIQWYDSGCLELKAKYQRGEVWSDSAKSFLIDSIMKDVPIPPLFIRQTIDITTKKTYREVIDGQQRLRAILDFYNGDLLWKRSHHGTGKSKYFKDLTSQEQIHFLNYTLFVHIVSQEADHVIFDMFTRLNSNSTPVNEQENRNAKYWGAFKTFIVELGEKLRPFLIKYNIFNSKAIVRMADLEFLSVLAQTTLQGITTETQKDINAFYDKNDKEFSDSNELFTKITYVFGLLDDVFTKMERDESYVFSKTYLYTIFCWIYNAKYGLKELDLPSGKNGINTKDISRVLLGLDYALGKIKLNDEKAVEDLDILEFERLHRVRTTSKNERIQRVKLFNRFMLKK